MATKGQKRGQDTLGGSAAIAHRYMLMAMGCQPLLCLTRAAIGGRLRRYCNMDHSCRKGLWLLA
eukprot:1158372-Pelagomonas_calceolata.AAC.11